MGYLSALSNVSDGIMPHRAVNVTINRYGASASISVVQVHWFDPLKHSRMPPNLVTNHVNGG